MVATEFHIDTPRLVISHFDSLQDSHCDFLVTLYDTEQNRDHKPVHSLMPDREAARKNIDSNDLIYSSGYGRYLAYTKIGVVGLKFRKFEGAPLAPDVGYGLLPAFQGKGYATEAAAALVRWFEEEKGQTEFFGFCDPNNEGSKAVLRRIGFKEWGVRNIKGIYSDGGTIIGMVFSKGLTKDLEAYGI
ncbi:hypothetical protein DPSP01_010232 [Paraphaeosphaeria sporulosa]|uniref:Acyl-CoA N-acyltransferase n=1 Tax=Paraphaeosphaeria sporulosa TaxID=1460663 RepID=A0A177C7Q3_9PLEO|nr:acyl-CoA N-acyltransferase [Paraphaeosphaeria sporulosa]OAG03161.1 acyl-CoA N-acyltransferase [Paraphaeosphaeria sporulosa]